MGEGRDSLMGRKLIKKHVTNGSNNGYEEHASGVEHDDSNLPDEKSFALAFEELSLMDRVVSDATNSYRFNETSLPTVIPQLNPLRSEITMDGVNYARLPMNSGYRPLPNDAVPEADVTASPYQQRFYLDTRTPSFMSSGPLGGSNMTCQSLEEERYFRLHGQNLYNQQNQNYGSDFFQFRNHMNPAIESLTGSHGQPFFEMPANANSYLNDNALRSQLNLSPVGGTQCQYHPHSSCRKGESYGFPYRPNAYSANDLLEWQVSDRVRRHYFPDKILTKSRGVNSLRSLRPDSVATNGRLFSNVHRNHTPFTINRSFTDGQDSRCYLPDSLYAKSLDLKYNSVDEVVGSIYYLAKDQLGCRFLQRKITEGKPEDVDKIFAEIIGDIVELMTDSFGNYLVQKLLEVCNEEQRMQILHAVTREAWTLMRISCDMHGTRTVQKVIQTLQTIQQISIVASYLKPGIVSLMKDVNGNHVAQRCLQYFSPEFNEFLYDAATACCTELAVDRQGCRVLQKCVQHSKGDRKNKLISAICSNSCFLSHDAYGNYVVQFVLDQEISWATAAVLGQLEGNYESLSIQKQGSNVVERCLKRASEEGRFKIIQELINNPRFLQIAQDRYGNYVVQSALEHCKGALLSVLIEAIEPHIPALHSSKFGSKVLSSSVLKKFA